MAAGSYVFELCRINANQGLTAEIDWNLALLESVALPENSIIVRGAKNSRSSGKNHFEFKTAKTRNDSSTFS